MGRTKIAPSLFRGAGVRMLLAASVSAGALTEPGVTSAQIVFRSRKVMTEAVDDYSDCRARYWPLANDLGPWATGDADGFRDHMLRAPNSLGYEAGLRWVNSQVWTTDFYDRERTTFGDSDDQHFDRYGNAFSYYAGHGTCPGGNTYVYCESASWCQSPPTGSTFPAFCKRAPGDNHGRCAYTRYDRSLVLGNCSGGGGFERRGLVDYSNPNAWVRWGESMWSGAWAGAGTNGGVNVVVLVGSCTELSGRTHEIFNAFGGMHLLADVFVHTGDTEINPRRGHEFAEEYQYHPYQAVSTSWLYSMNFLIGGKACMNEAQTQSYGGFYGYGGCGGHKITAMGATEAEALAFLNENFDDVQKDARDATGAAYFATQFLCNWDCNYWGFGL